LKGEYELIEARFKNRAGHFFDEKLLMSQFEAYEKPKDGLVVSIEQFPEEIVGGILAEIDLS
jgi:gluconate kinase